ncbi:MAG: 30S ribosomal protein S4 [Candidatus Eremiobacteraeota bacterium]|nr:30S ribosomal protein S4 [Candidatus Eremiobacteraeota bacterium]
MARYTGASCRLCRREGVKLYLKGERCYTSKCAIERRRVPPGMHGLSRRKPTQYAIQLREKQKLKRIYGLTEKQFKLTFARAEKMKGVAGDNFLGLLERRLDNVIYRLGLAASRKQARQLVCHGHLQVKGRKVDIPSYLTKPGEEIAIREKSRDIPFIREGMEKSTATVVPTWLELDPKEMKANVIRIPGPEDFTDIQVDEKLVVEFYSR